MCVCLGALPGGYTRSHFLPLSQSRHFHHLKSPLCPVPSVPHYPPPWSQAILICHYRWVLPGLKFHMHSDMRCNFCTWLLLLPVAFLGFPHLHLPVAQSFMCLVASRCGSDCTQQFWCPVWEVWQGSRAPGDYMRCLFAAPSHQLSQPLRKAERKSKSTNKMWGGVFSSRPWVPRLLE